jgi:hypothetical protein
MAETSTMGFDRAEHRRIYEYVEGKGAVAPEAARQAVLVRPESSSKPARSGAALSPSVPMTSETSGTTYPSSNATATSRRPAGSSG